MKNALIVIDVQNDYFPGGAWPLEGAEEVASEIVGAVRQAYKAGWWWVYSMLPRLMRPSCARAALARIS